jgi:hypothetical protein
MTLHGSLLPLTICLLFLGCSPTARLLDLRWGGDLAQTLSRFEAAVEFDPAVSGKFVSSDGKYARYTKITLYQVSFDTAILRFQEGFSDFLFIRNKSSREDYQQFRSKLLSLYEDPVRTITHTVGDFTALSTYWEFPPEPVENSEDVNDAALWLRIPDMVLYWRGEGKVLPMVG